MQEVLKNLLVWWGKLVFHGQGDEVIWLIQHLVPGELAYIRVLLVNFQIISGTLQVKLCQFQLNLCSVIQKCFRALY